MGVVYLHPVLPTPGETASSNSAFMPDDPDLTVCEGTATYVPRNPEATVLYSVVAGHLETFLARQLERDRLVPWFVEKELRSFLECGILANGFVRVHCDDCHQDRLIPFSCKGRSFCPSCGGRRMADTAAHLVDRVFPEAPVRQWVLSLPYSLRYRLAYDARLVREMLQVFVRAVFASVRRRGGIPASDRKARCGAVTFVQRFGDALNLNVHFHTLAIDGIYVTDDAGDLEFRRVGPPSDAEVARVANRVSRGVIRLLERRGLGPQMSADESDALPQSQPLLAELYGASISGLVAAGPRAGAHLSRVGDAVEVEDLPAATGRSCAVVSGFSVHAGVCISAHNRLRLEHLFRYAGRPPLATERLAALPDGRLLYRLKRRWRDGTSHVIFEPLDLVARLATLVPPPRFNLVRYHGILAPCAALRRMVVPQCAPDGQPDQNRHPGCSNKSGNFPDGSGNSELKGQCRPRNYSWAELMKRVWSLDVLQCDRCGGRMRIVCANHPPAAVKSILECLGLPSRPPPIAPATSITEDCATDL
jgi:hypothetical protein